MRSEITASVEISEKGQIGSVIISKLTQTYYMFVTIPVPCYDVGILELMGNRMRCSIKQHFVTN